MLPEARNQFIAGICAVAVGLVLARLAPVLDLSVTALVLIFFVAVAVSFTRGTDGLYLVIFAILFSPEISPVGGTPGEEGGALVIRLEDVLLVAVALGWVFRSAYQHRQTGIVHTRVNRAIWIYMAASVLATLWGILQGTVESFPSALFHNLKYFEYFLIYFMILAHVRKAETVRGMIKAMLVAFALVLVYGYTQLGSGVRVAAPFDTEPNTFGGYIVLMQCIAAGIALVDSRARVRLSMIFLLLFAMPPLLFTLSRSSYLSLIVAVLAFMVVSHHRVIIGATSVALLAAMLLGLPLLPERVQQRTAGTFKQNASVHVQIAGVDLDGSASARILSYKAAAKEWTERPFLGRGVTGAGFLDGQMQRLLTETGAIGLAAFLLIFWLLTGEVRKAMHATTEPFFKGATMGFLCGIAAMLAHSLTANTFVIVRIAEPFWMLAGLVLLIPRLVSTDHENPDHPSAEGAVA